MQYFDGKISKDLMYLYISRIIVAFSTGFFSIFIPIFLYKSFSDNITPVLMLYFFSSVATVVISPFSARYIEKYDLKKSIYIAIIFNILFKIALSFTDNANFSILIPTAFFFITISRLFYWLPYHTTFTKFSDQKNRMREVTALQAILHTVGIMSPLIAGLIISNFSYQILFFIGIVVFALSVIPLTFMSAVYETFSWSYSETWRNLFSKKYRHAMVAYFADGVETAVGLVIWPIFIFNLLKGNYISIGLISTLTIAITIILEVLIGKKADTTLSKRGVLKINSILYAFGWLIKIFIITGFQIFLADMYHKITQSLSRNSMDAITYDIAADEGHYVDEFTIIKEMALHSGRSALYIIAIILIIFVNIQWVFVFAAISAVLVNSIRLYKKA